MQDSVCESHLLLQHGRLSSVDDGVLHHVDEGRPAAEHARGCRRPRQHLHQPFAGAEARRLSELAGRGPLSVGGSGPSRHPGERDLRLPLYTEGHDRPAALSPPSQGVVLLQPGVDLWRLDGDERPEDHHHPRLRRRRHGHAQRQGHAATADTGIPPAHQDRPPSGGQSLGQLQCLSLHRLRARRDDALHVPHLSLLAGHGAEVRTW